MRPLTQTEMCEFWYEMMMAADHHLTLCTKGVCDYDFYRCQEIWAIYEQMPDDLYKPDLNEDTFRSISY